jgi:predicted nucleic acid-binding protein
MSVFVDTSGLLAAFDTNEERHEAAKAMWLELLAGTERLVTTNYVLVETLALVQKRYGMEAVRLIAGTALPALHVIWVDEDLHRAAFRAVLEENRRKLSLVDCVGFEAMARRNLSRVFTLDHHFAEQGFEVLP